MIRRTNKRRTVFTYLPKSGSGVIAGFMVTRSNHWIVDELPTNL